MPIHVLIAAQDCAAIELLRACVSSDAALALSEVCPTGAGVLPEAMKAGADVAVLDLRICSLESIRENRGHNGTAVVAMDVSAENALRALGAGAADFVLIPSAGSDSDGRLFAADALERIKAAAIPAEAIPYARGKASNKPLRLLAVACAGGGPAPVGCLLKGLPADGPAVLVLQRNASAFAGEYAEKLRAISGKNILLCDNGVEIKTGSVYLADEERAISLKKTGEKLVLQSGGAPGGFSSDALFEAAAQSLGKEAACVLLSGRGAEGLKRAAARGSLAILQNKNALLRRIGYKAPAGILELPLEDIADAIRNRMNGVS